MSRVIDTSDLGALSDDDLVYAFSHNLISDDQRKELGLTIKDVQKIIASGQRFPADAQNQGHAGPQMDPDEYEEFLEFRKANRRERPTPAIEPDDRSRVVADNDEYEGMSNDRLRAELADRHDAQGHSLDVTGKKDDLIARLRADDEARAEAGDEDDDEENEGS